MKIKRFSEEQFIGYLKEAEAGIPVSRTVAGSCRSHWADTARGPAPRSQA